MKKTFFVLLAVMLLAALTGCVPGDGTNTLADPAGFFSGIWHGWIAPFSLVYSLVTKETGIYEVFNNGFRYNLGYYMAIISGFGGLAISRGKKKKRHGEVEVGAWHDGPNGN